ncbi:MAG: hypothetical protein RBQ81_08435 [Arcobacteraceae bacterium]|jgi:CRISPR-associated protein Csm1|nr:hypothetical protein [Arcobacteraceae bacterium]
MRVYNKYFNNGYEYLSPKQKTNIEELLSDEMWIISGDFYGIQKFIFEGLSTKNAAKVLRAKSAYVELFTITLARYICSKLGISEKNILTTNAGKFEIISSNKDIKIIEEIQKTIDSFFIKNFYALSSVNISYVDCKKSDFNKGEYKKLREKIAKSIEAKKFEKFDISNLKNPILDYDTNIDNQTLCRICNIRKIDKENCEICDMFVKLGQILVGNKKSINSSEDLLINLGDFSIDIELSERIKSYILKSADNKPVTFEDLAKSSCKDLEGGIKALGILKADVDNMGIFIKDSDVTEHFSNFELFSKTLDAFFSIYIPNLMSEKYPNTYTVFAGGDDLFLVGAWDSILQLAREIESEFKKFIKSKDLTISFGISVAKESTPISYLAEYTESLLESSKELDGKDSISMFKESVKWGNYKEVFIKLDDVFIDLSKDINTAFLYRLLQFCDMSKNKHDIENTIWRSKFRYSVSRNNTNLPENSLTVLSESIEKSPSETKMFLSEFIYKRRDL